jgi:hypothetical protein
MYTTAFDASGKEDDPKVSGRRQHRGDEASGRIAPDCEPSGIKAVQCRIGAKKAHGGLAVLNCGTGKVDKTVTRTAKEAVIETDDRITFVGQRTDIRSLDLIRPIWSSWCGRRAEIASWHRVFVANPEAAPVNPNDQRCGLVSCRR